MDPWEFFWIALGWLCVLALLLIVAIMILATSVQAFNAARKEMTRKAVDLDLEQYMNEAADVGIELYKDEVFRSDLSEAFRAGARFGWGYFSRLNRS